MSHKTATTRHKLTQNKQQQDINSNKTLAHTKQQKQDISLHNTSTKQQDTSSHKTATTRHKLTQNEQQ